MIKKSIPEIYDKCTSCKARPSEERFCDIVGLMIGTGGPLIHLCHGCALELVKLLLGRFYALWGPGPLMEFMASEVDVEREACAEIVETAGLEWESMYDRPGSECIAIHPGDTRAAWAAAIRARGGEGEGEGEEACPGT